MIRNVLRPATNIPGPILAGSKTAWNNIMFTETGNNANRAAGTAFLITNNRPTIASTPPTSIHMYPLSVKALNKFSAPTLSPKSNAGM